MKERSLSLSFTAEEMNSASGIFSNFVFFFLFQDIFEIEWISLSLDEHGKGRQA